MAEQSGGYDYEFVQIPSDTLICQICHCPSKEPHLSLCCGHIFCKSCLEAAKKVKSVPRACPTCRNREFVTVFNKQADRIIRNLHVYCPSKDKGCEWQGEVNAIVGHIDGKDGCQFQEVNCPNDCRAAYQRQHLTRHAETECPRRKANCQYCHSTGEHQFIEGQHKYECPKLPLPCPNNCEFGSIPRDGIREHIFVCPLQLSQCKYHVIGCEAIMARKDQEKHNKEMMEEHLSLSVTELAATKISIVSFRKQIAANKFAMEKEFRAQLSASQHSAQKAIHDLTQQLAAAENEIAALKQQVDALISVSHKALVKPEQSKVTGATKKSTFDPTSKLKPVLWNIDLDNQAAILLSGNAVLPVVVKMSEFSKKKRQKVRWFSEPFFTQTNGYKMLMKVLPNGDVGLVTGSHITVCLFVMKGPYDDHLNWPMRGEYEVKLLNQTSNSMHHSVICTICEQNSHKPIGNRNKYAAWYSEYFVSHDFLTTTKGFIKDDIIYFQVCKPLH